VNTHSKSSFWIGAGLAILLGTAPLAAQTGSISGVVRTDTGEPVGAVQVSIVGTALGTLTQANGQYLLLQVPAGEHQVNVELIGYAAVTRPVTVRAGQTTTLNITLVPDAVALQELVVTGVAGATRRAKVPFDVAQIRAEDLPVPQVSAGTAIQGKVAGAMVVQGSGRPGAPPSILLRGPTSINSTGRDQEPLYIVDGVILGASMVDIDAMDIETIEVVKGAAAASLYGSRAANGVIQITTRRGSRIADDQVRYSVRSEYGRSSLPGRFDLTQAHHYAMQDGMFVNTDGTLCTWLECSSPRMAGQRAAAGENPTIWNTFQTNDWPQTFDHVALFFNPGDFLQNYLSAEGRSGQTNYHASVTHLNEQGVMPGQEGFQRLNFRLNLDQSVRDNLTVSASTFFSRSNQDLFPESQGNPLFNLTRMPAGVDLRAVDADGQLIMRPDPHEENANPLYEMLNRDFQRDRSRFLGSGNVRFAPVGWLELDANVSYDRYTQDDSDFYDKGFRTARPSAVNTGHVYQFSSNTEALNTSFTATLRRSFGDVLNTRTQVRSLYEQQDYAYNSGWGYELGASGVPSLHNVGGDQTVRSQQQSIRSMGYFLITNLDFYDRYIVDALVRRDGSSLFGADERWQNYWRIASAWRIGEEPWFDVPAVDELKVRYSYGTAGGRPNFWAQYETYNVLNGVLTPTSLGNRNLRPERAAEHEVGLDMSLFNRITLDLTYADNTTTDQILNVPLAGYTGFSNRWINAGTLSSNTFEASLGARLVQTRDLTWSARLLFDRTRQTISELNVADFTYGVGGQAMDAAFYAREGERLGTFYGYRFVQSCNQLVEAAQDFCNTHFQTNDDGYLVFVGQGNSWRDGLWGTTGSAGGVNYNWGSPIVAWDADPITGERTNFLPIGNTMPDYSMSLSSTLNWRGFSLYGLLDAVQGFDVYNQPLQWATFQNYSGIMDQRGKPEAEQKPLGYYAALYNSLAPTNQHWVEDGSFIKLRELSVRYRLTPQQLGTMPVLGAFEGLTLSVSGRNLVTWSDYNGYDPEVGRAGGDVGSAAIARVDGYNYPNYRTLTFGVEVNF
jgi:TonB-linked SusC/RagA family outer membrane protein